MMHQVPPNGQIIVKEYHISDYYVHIRPSRMGGWIGSVLDKFKNPIRSTISYSEHSALFECKLHIEEEIHNASVGNPESQQPKPENCGDVQHPT